MVNATPAWQEIFKNVSWGSGDPKAKDEKKLRSYGYDVTQGKYGDLFDLGIIDPVKVVRLALQNAVSVASMILTTEAMITDLPEKEEKTPPMPAAGGMPGGMGM